MCPDNDPQRSEGVPESEQLSLDGLSLLKGLDPNQLNEMADMIRGQAPYFTMAVGFAILSHALGMITGVISEVWDPGVDVAPLVLAELAAGSSLWLGGLVAAGWAYANSFRRAGEIQGRSQELYTEHEKERMRLDAKRVEVDQIYAETAKLELERQPERKDEF